MAISPKILQRIRALRGELWPELTKEDLWNRKTHDGFTTIPRTMPIIMSIIDDLTRGAPASLVYLELWARAFDEMYINLKNRRELSFHSGLTGQRAENTWIKRMKALEKFGFIKTAKGTSGDLSHAVVLNPYIVIEKLYKDKKNINISEYKYNAFKERAIEIGASKFPENDLLEKP